MSLLHVIFAPDSNNVVTNDVWGRCAPAKALAARAGSNGRPSRAPVMDDARLEHLRQLGWSTVRVDHGEEKTAA